MSDEFYGYKGSQYGDGIMLNEYNGELSLVAAKQKEDQVYMEWIFPQKKDGSKQPLDKSLPWKIKLGNKEEASEILRFFLGKLEGVGAEGTNPGDRVPGTDDDIPF